MNPSRRNAFLRLVAAVSAGAAALRAPSAAAAESPAIWAAGAPSAGVPKVAYHLADLDKVDFVLGNIANHFRGVGGPDKVRIELVVHGPALLAFRLGRANPDLRRRLAQIAGQGAVLGACGNTLDAQKLSAADLLPGFSRIDEGGVVRLARLQAQGYAYLRP